MKEDEEDVSEEDSEEEEQQDMFVYSKPYSFLSSLGGNKTSLRKIKKKNDDKLKEENHYKCRMKRLLSSNAQVHIVLGHNVDYSMKNQIKSNRLRP